MPFQLYYNDDSELYDISGVRTSCSHSAYEKSEGKMAEIDVYEGRKQFSFQCWNNMLAPFDRACQGFFPGFSLGSVFAEKIEFS
jgi:hypothetical protein